ncbi:MAG: hypothetical protein A3F89_07165 [Deltaproteobacteria bacterium RIFCSPLOWO2_12_FULL_50_11]|nr:MAG: hypothetical protein A3F89_07165 [Deltaproteobacteria bacterium RIFCSPLOWO2_12_FULL_50_11]
MFKRLSFFIATVIFLPVTLWAASFPRPQGLVNDFAHVLSTTTKVQLTQHVTELKQKTGIELAIVTLPSLEEEPIETATVRLFEEWGIGEKKKDSGLLILLAVEDKQARIEVGYGLEGMIPDALAGRILREGMIPFFKKGQLDQGLVMGTQLLLTRIGQQMGVALTGQVDSQAWRSGRNGESPPSVSILSLIFKCIIIIFLVILFIKNPFLFFLLLGSMRGGRGGGGFGGGFGGFGGGLSGGGGASGRW